MKRSHTPPRPSRSAPARRGGGPPRRNDRRSSPYRLFTLAALLAGSAVAVALRLGFSLDWLLACLAGANVATFVLYAYDKAAAARGNWLRVPERVLHAAALLGGTPAALLAQGWLRHKTLKRPFRIWFLAILTVQALVVIAWAYWRYGQP